MCVPSGRAVPLPSGCPLTAVRDRSFFSLRMLSGEDAANIEALRRDGPDDSLIKPTIKVPSAVWWRPAEDFVGAGETP